MFRIDTTGTIQINRGDTGETVFYVNTGSTALCEYLYSFLPDIKISLSENIKDYDVELNSQTWMNKVLTAGSYVFSWDIDGRVWLLDEEEVDIATYGLSLPNRVSSDIPEDATITVTYALCNSESEVYFYVWHPLQQLGEVPVMKKTIKPYINTVITEINGEESYTEVRNCVDVYGNPLLHFNPQDTETILQGEYRYQVKAKLYMNNSYITNTVCNRTPFLVIEDDYADRIWYDNL